MEQHPSVIAECTYCEQEGIEKCPMCEYPFCVDCLQEHLASLYAGITVIKGQDLCPRQELKGLIDKFEKMQIVEPIDIECEDGFELGDLIQ